MNYYGQMTKIMPLTNSLDQTKSNLGIEGSKHSDSTHAKVNVVVSSIFINSKEESGTRKCDGDEVRCISGFLKISKAYQS